MTLMTTRLVTAVALLAVLASHVAAQALSTFPATPLASLHFPTPSDAPEQADPGNLARGNQTGYNRCNSTTEDQQSLCQTSFVNDLSDFCLWAPPMPNSTIGDSEGEEVAWCTKKGHGTRIIPEGALLGVQLLKAPDYVMLTGLINQSFINIASDDPGGELDPHGQDLRGNPIGGLMYSTQFSNGAGPMQVIEWVNFMGSNSFCLKICDPAGKNPAGFCQHTLDRIGCAYNAPSKYTVQPAAGPGEFASCESDDMAIPGEYVVNGQTLSYAQPPESVPIGALPYQPSIPASSNCVTSASTALYTDAVAVPIVSGSVTITPSGSSGRSGTAAGAAPSRTGSSAVVNAGASVLAAALGGAFALIMA